MVGVVSKGMGEKCRCPWSNTKRKKRGALGRCTCAHKHNTCTYTHQQHHPMFCLFQRYNSTLFSVSFNTNLIWLSLTGRQLTPCRPAEERAFRGNVPEWMR